MKENFIDKIINKFTELTQRFAQVKKQAYEAYVERTKSFLKFCFLFYSRFTKTCYQLLVDSIDATERNFHHVIKTLMTGALLSLAITKVVSPLLRLVGVNMGLHSIQILEFYCIGIAAQAHGKSKKDEKNTQTLTSFKNHIISEYNNLFRVSNALYLGLTSITTLSYILYLSDPSRILNTPIYKLIEISSNVLSLTGVAGSGISLPDLIFSPSVLYPFAMTYVAGLALTGLVSHKSGHSLFHYMSINNIVQSAVFATLTNAAFLFVCSGHYQIAAAVYMITYIPLLEFASAALNNGNFDYHKLVAMLSIGMHMLEAACYVTAGTLGLSSLPVAVSAFKQISSVAKTLSSDVVQGCMLSATTYSFACRVNEDLGQSAKPVK